jgi:hypothetical protein
MVQAAADPAEAAAHVAVRDERGPTDGRMEPGHGAHSPCSVITSGVVRWFGGC